ncbi:hypothetical protein BDD14_3984 [Edaphobacter modestus]|uniref:Uncharacterized protein n=1 Tax=Edaphobacter modestus TaxID=388466 RepID=A0A4Q7YX44_9BACT|nr:hypothetical protein BDD14_3984 [Edaphobacter modestus]
MSPVNPGQNPTKDSLVCPTAVNSVLTSWFLPSRQCYRKDCETLGLYRDCPDTDPRGRTNS